MAPLVEIIRQTPFWVYFLFLGLVFAGLQATRPRSMHLYRLLFLPILFTLLNLTWLSERIWGHFSLLIFWVIGLACGSFLGWLMVRNWTLHISKQHKTITLPPTWSTLILILLFFVIRYFFIYHYELYPETIPHLFLPDALTSGIMTGIFIGRSYQIYTKYKNS